MKAFAIQNFLNAYFFFSFVSKLRSLYPLTLDSYTWLGQVSKGDDIKFKPRAKFQSL